MKSSAPTRDTLLTKLKELRSGASSRSEVSAWAIAYIVDDSLRLTDPTVMQALQRLGAVDLPSTDREYLYVDVDFEEWVSELLRDQVVKMNRAGFAGDFNLREDGVYGNSKAIFIRGT